jgi:hypothetical protein
MLIKGSAVTIQGGSTMVVWVKVLY